MKTGVALLAVTTLVLAAAPALAAPPQELSRLLHHEASSWAPCVVTGGALHTGFGIASAFRPAPLPTVAGITMATFAPCVGAGIVLGIASAERRAGASAGRLVRGGRAAAIVGGVLLGISGGLMPMFAVVWAYEARPWLGVTTLFSFNFAVLGAGIFVERQARRRVSRSRRASEDP